MPERGELNIVHGVLLKLSRIIVPSCMRLQVLEKIHEGRQGITKRREPASGGGLARSQSSSTRHG